MSKIYGYATYFACEEALGQVAALVDQMTDAGAEEIITELLQVASAETPQLDQLLSNAGPGSSIIVPAIHRLCSSAQKFLQVISIIQLKQMCLFIPDKLLLDFRTGEGDPMSRGFLHALTLLAEMERAVRSDLIRKGLDRARAKGRPLGRRPTTITDIPPIFLRHLPSFYAGYLNISTLARICNLSRPTVYKYLRLINGHSGSDHSEAHTQQNST